jgi:uncharacterized membrane protein
VTLRPGETQVVRRAPKWLLAVLIVSLLINGLIIGAVASRWKALHAEVPSLGSSTNAQLFGFAVTLPPERRREVWAAVEADRASVRPLRQAVHAARDEARKVLLTEPFDPVRYAAAQEKLFEAEQILRKRALDVVQAIAQQLTPKERAAVAHWEERDRSQRRAFWRGMRGEDDKGPRSRGEQGKN